MTATVLFTGMLKMPGIADDVLAALFLLFCLSCLSVFLSRSPLYFRRRGISAGWLTASHDSDCDWMSDAEESMLFRCRD